MIRKSIWTAFILSAVVGFSSAFAQQAPTTARASSTPATKPSALPKPPRTAENAVSEVDRNPKRHEAFLAKIKEGGTHNLLFIGDSITDFWPRRAKETWAKFDEYKPLNLGISGERTEDVLFRLNHGELEGLAPKVVVIMIGTNNFGQHADEKPEWTASGVDKIVKAVREKLPQSKILLLGIFPRETANSVRRKKVTVVNEVISKLDDGKNVFYLDIGDKFLDEKGDIPKDVMGDALHPTAKGYDIWYDAMKPKLDELMK